MKYRIMEKAKGVVTAHRNLWDEKTAMGFCAHLQRVFKHATFWVVKVQEPVIGSQSEGDAKTGYNAPNALVDNRIP